MLNKSLARVTLVALLAATLLVAPGGNNVVAQSATGATSFSITFPQIVILHYWQQLDMDVNAGAVEDYIMGASYAGETPAQTGVTISESGGVFSGDAAVTQSTANAPGTVSVRVNNAWAVRAIGNGTANNTTVAATSIGNMTKGSDTMTTSNFQVAESSGTLAGTAVFNQPGLSTPTLGDVGFDMDLTELTESGQWSGTWTVTVTVT